MNVRQVIPRDAVPSAGDPRFTETYDGSDDGLFAFVWRDEHGLDAFFLV